MMTPKEELIQAIDKSPDQIVLTLLEILRVLQRQSMLADHQSRQVANSNHETISPRLHRKQGVLVIETGRLEGFDMNAFIGEMREERIQNQIEQVDL
ncbi:hypothetical protein ACQ4M3_32105 [Leptolyngbya sp. AN03gr2]|uniref:hypothetical protein n=1 Tax=unclassified Leptolyngbya TaxID=2650499 RepID=UPI003D322D3B